MLNMDFNVSSEMSLEEKKVLLSEYIRYLHKFIQDINLYIENLSALSTTFLNISWHASDDSSSLIKPKIKDNCQKKILLPCRGQINDLINTYRTKQALTEEKISRELTTFRSGNNTLKRIQKAIKLKQQVLDTTYQDVEQVFDTLERTTQVCTSLFYCNKK